MDRDKVKHEGKGSGQAEEGLEERGASASATVRNTRMNTDGVPRTCEDGSMDWAKVNHNGFSEK